jgi:hypothetical protein
MYQIFPSRFRYRRQAPAQVYNSEPNYRTIDNYSVASRLTAASPVASASSTWTKRSSERDPSAAHHYIHELLETEGASQYVLACVRAEAR